MTALAGPRFMCVSMNAGSCKVTNEGAVVAELRLNDQPSMAPGHVLAG